MDRLLWIAVGGAFGTLARYGVTVLCHQRFGVAFPYGTLVVNLVGSFALAVVVQLCSAWAWSETTRLALAAGVMGGFTTYSSFNHETTKLFEQGAWKAAVVNLLATVLGCLAAGLLGAAAGRRIAG